jgi:hypothetical protein
VQSTDRHIHPRQSQILFRDLPSEGLDQSFLLVDFVDDRVVIVMRKPMHYAAAWPEFRKARQKNVLRELRR